jgi:hypothetical protein
MGIERSFEEIGHEREATKKTLTQKKTNKKTKTKNKKAHNHTLRAHFTGKGKDRHMLSECTLSYELSQLLLVWDCYRREYMTLVCIRIS